MPGLSGLGFFQKNRQPLGCIRVLSMCKILLEGANEWKKMGRRSII